MKVDIQWNNPERYSDMEENLQYSRSLFRQFSNEMESFIQDKAHLYLPTDTTLELTFRDVDLAGEAEPWRRPSADEIRIIKDVYPPRLKFNYKVIDESGEILKEGMAQITDTTYLWNAAQPGTMRDKFYYEKELMADWLRKNLDNLPPIS
ncbi:MAG: DUF3016 domain-containing protein [Verrucomicrobiae bacterium]|nr:DUF3016 domain-containing protein [Verrucomicrobiae bacterium]